MSNKAYCQCCGQKCTPEMFRRSAKDFDGRTCVGGLIDNWRSPCYHDTLSAVPVTDWCCQCGEVAPRGAKFPKIEDKTFCPGCLANYRMDSWRYLR